MRREVRGNGMANVTALQPAARAARAAATVETGPAHPLPSPDGWPAFVASLGLTGMSAQLAAQTELRGIKGNVLTLALPPSHKHLADKTYADRLKSALEAAVQRKLLLAFEVGDAVDDSLAARTRRERAEAMAKGEQAFRDEPFVQELISRFDARIKPETVDPLPAAELPSSITRNPSS
jgi:DNA polymerase-3 subunit gamma/tau